MVDVASVTLTAANIITELGRLYDALPIVVRRHQSMKIFIDQTAHDFYGDALRNQTTKGLEQWAANPDIFKGIQLVPLVGMPADKMVGTYADNTRGSNIWLGIADSSDFVAPKMAPLQPNSDLWFFRMKMAADTQIVFGEHLVLYS